MERLTTLCHDYKGDFYQGCPYSCEQKLGQLEDIEDELGLPLNVYVYLTQKYFKDEEIYIENIYDDEEERKLTKQVNGREQRYIVDIDFVKRKVIIQGTEKWTTAKFKDYGKIWALTKEELK